MTPDVEQWPVGEKKWSMAWAVSRRSIALLLLLLLTGTAIRSNLSRHPRICVDTMTTISARPVIRLCHPLGVTDAPIILVLAVIAALIVPDVSRISIGGLVELERSVKESVREQEKLAKDVERILGLASANAQAVTNNYFVHPGEAASRNRAAFERKVEDFRAKSEIWDENEGT